MLTARANTVISINACAVEALQNRCSGPGGGTQRLHHRYIRIVFDTKAGQAGCIFDGGEIGSTDSVKAVSRR